MILYINACVREESRTERLANALLERLGEYTEIRLEELDLKPLNRERLNQRAKLQEKGDFNNGMFSLARQFAQADTIVVAAPYWDNMFPAILKIYLELIYVIGIVTSYDENGCPVGLCRADNLYFVTTAGGPYVPDFCFNYVKKLAEHRFGIKNTRQFYADMLDVVGYDAGEIMEKAIDEIKAAHI